MTFVRVSVILLMQFHRDQICPAARRGPAAKRKPLTAISGTDQSQLCVAWRTRLILNNRLSAVPIFFASLVFPCPGFRAPVFAMSFRSSTNSRGKIGTARSLFFSEDYCFSDSGSIFLIFWRFEAENILKIFLEYRSIK